MLLNPLSSDTYLVFHIKINDDSCDLLFNTLFISLDPKYDSMYKLHSKRLVMMSASLCRVCKILHLPEFPMLLDLFHIKINYDSCDLLFDNHFIS